MTTMPENTASSEQTISIAKSNILSRLHLVDFAYLIALIGISPLAWLECASMWNQPHLQFFPLAWGAFAYLTYQRAGELTFCEGRLRWAAGLGMLVISFMAGCVSVYISSFWFGYVSALTLITSWTLIRFGHSSTASLLATSSMLFITVRIPSGYDTDLIHYLQYQSSRLLSAALDGMGIVNVPAGNVFEILSKKLFVDEACSGVDSLYALLACSLFIFLLYRAKWIVAVLALPLVFVWASCGNFIRLLIIVLGLEWFQVDLSTGIGHSIIGLVAFVISFGCDLAFITAATAFFESPRRSKKPKAIEKVKPIIQNAPMTFAGAVAFVALTFCGFGAIGFSALRTRSLQSFPEIPKPLVEQVFNQGQLPEQIGPWKMRSFQIVEREANNTMGHYSAVWLYVKEDTMLTVSADFPFRGFHRLDFCYTSAGWSIVSDLRREKLAFDERGTVEIRDMTNQQNNHAHLVYTLFEANGTPAPWKGVGIRGFERLEQSILDPITYQVQCIAEASHPISEADRQAVYAIHAQASQLLMGTFGQLNPQAK